MFILANDNGDSLRTHRNDSHSMYRETTCFLYTHAHTPWTALKLAKSPPCETKATMRNPAVQVLLHRVL